MSEAEKSLAGVRVVVTRSAQQAPELTDALAAIGADVIEVPVIQLVDPDDHGAALTSSLQQLETYDWVVFTSVNAVERVAPLVDDRITCAQVAAVGPSTAQALHAHGIGVTLMPAEFIPESLVEAFPNGPGKVLLPRAQVARDVLPDGLRAKGWKVDIAAAYKTISATVSSDVRDRLRCADAITFTSASTVSNFIELFGIESVPPVVATIGPATSASAESCGLRVSATAANHTVDGLVDALATAIAEQTEG